MTGVTESTERGDSMLAATSNAMVALHKEQFGRGPTRSRSHFAGRDTLVCVLHHALLPAEHAMVEMGDQARVRETRVAFQAATRDRFVEAVEKIVNRRVVAFASAIDPDHDVVWEVFNFDPVDPQSDGKMNTHPDTEPS